MLTPEQYAETAARWQALQKEARPLADAMQATRDAMFTVCIENPRGELLAAIIANRDKTGLRNYYNNPHAVPLHAWVNVAPAVWKQRTQ